MPVSKTQARLFRRAALARLFDSKMDLVRARREALATSIELLKSAGAKPDEATINRLRQELKWHPMLQWEIRNHDEARGKARFELELLRQMLPQKNPKKAKRAK